MTSTRRIAASASRPALHVTISLLMVIGVHLVLDVALISRSWLWSQSAIMTALAIPLSQLSLLVIWAVVASNNPILRFAIPPLAIATCWSLMSRILPWGIGEAASAGWAMALVVQVVAMIAAIECFRFVRSRPPGNESHEGSADPRRLKFGMSTLMLWTTAIAIGFGLIRFGTHYWHWSVGVFSWKLMGAMPIIGSANALVALLSLWAFSTRGSAKQGGRIAVSLLLVVGLALLMSYSTKWMTGLVVLPLWEALIVLVAQSLSISLSLAIAKLGYD